MQKGILTGGRKVVHLSRCNWNQQTAGPSTALPPLRVGNYAQDDRVGGKPHCVGKHAQSWKDGIENDGRHVTRFYCALG